MIRLVFINKSEMTIIICYFRFKAQRNNESECRINKVWSINNMVYGYVKKGNNIHSYNGK